MINHGKCPDREQLFAYAHRMLDSPEHGAAREHVENCAVCGQIVMEFQKLDTVLDEWQSVAPSDWFDARVRAAVAAEVPTPSRFTLFGLRWAQVLSPACLVLLLVVASLMLSRTRETKSTLRSTQPITEPARIPATRVEEELTLYKDLPVLEDEDYEMLANFEILSELPRGEKKLEN